MNDGFNNTELQVIGKAMNDQTIRSDEKRAIQQSNQAYIENMLDFNQWSADPDVINRFGELDELTKNWNLGNYKEADQYYLEKIEDALTDIESLLPKNHKNSKIRKSFIRDIEARIMLTRGKNGFFQKMLVTQLGESSIKLSNTTPKGILSGLKRRKE